MTVIPASDQALVDSGKPALKVMIVDDHQMIQETLSRYLAEIGSVSITEARDFVSAFTAIAQEPDFDLVLLDIRMPGVDGFTTLANLRRLFPELRVVILSGSVDLADIRRAAEKGAAGYLPKSMDHIPLVNALRLILSGEQFFPARIFHPIDSQYPQPMTAPDLNNPGAVELTSRQKTVLEELAKGMSNREGARHFRDYGENPRAFDLPKTGGTKPSASRTARPQPGNAARLIAGVRFAPDAR